MAGTWFIFYLITYELITKLQLPLYGLLQPGYVPVTHYSFRENIEEFCTEVCNVLLRIALWSSGIGQLSSLSEYDSHRPQLQP